MKLSKRLLAIAKMIEKHSNHGLMADIGSDHGYLPVWLVLEDVVSKAIACDIADGPLQACLSTVQLSHTEDKISVKKGDGLAPVVHEKLDVASICGMGGNLICDILEADLDKSNINTLVIEANVNEPLVRNWLIHHGWQIIDECIVEDMKHYYEVIVARIGNQSLTEYERYFGPVLLQIKDETFKKKWQWQKEVHEKILRGITPEHEKYGEIIKEYTWIKEILNEN